MRMPIIKVSHRLLAHHTTSEENSGYCLQNKKFGFVTFICVIVPRTEAGAELT